MMSQRTDSLLHEDKTLRVLTLWVAMMGGVFFLWATFAPLDEGVTATGVLTVQDSNKEVSHLEGGIIRKIHVSEGDSVVGGQPLIVLEPIATEAGRDELAQDFANSLASMLRYDALRLGDTDPGLDRVAEVDLDHDTLRPLLEEQARLFREQRIAHDASIATLQARLSAVEERLPTQERELAALKVARSSAERDLATKRRALEEGLELAAHVERLARELARLERDEANMHGQVIAATKDAETLRAELVEANAAFLKDVSEERVEAHNRMLTARERLKAHDDRVARTIIKAPLSGEVLGLTANTVGGVVDPGETLMMIVPEDGLIEAVLEVAPNDRDAIRPGQTVEAQLSAYKQYRVPRVEGHVIGISGDLLQDEQAGRAYFEVRIALDMATIRNGEDVQILPGMPIDGFIASGRQRTLLDYALEPIVSVLRRGSRMN